MSAPSASRCFGLGDSCSDGGGGGGGDVASVNGKTGIVVLDADDVGAVPGDASPAGQSVYIANGNGPDGTILLRGGPVASSVPLRVADGQLRVGDAVLADAAVPLAQADGRYDPAGAAVAEVAGLPVVDDGWGIAVDASTPGLLRLHRRPLSGVSSGPQTGAGSHDLIIDPIVVPGAWAALPDNPPMTLSLSGAVSNPGGSPADLTLAIQVNGSPVWAWTLGIPAGANLAPLMVSCVGAIGALVTNRFIVGSGRVDLGGTAPDTTMSAPAVVSWSAGDSPALNITAAHSSADLDTRLFAAIVDIGVP